MAGWFYMHGNSPWATLNAFCSVVERQNASPETSTHGEDLLKTVNLLRNFLQSRPAFSAAPSEAVIFHLTAHTITLLLQLGATHRHRQLKIESILALIDLCAALEHPDLIAAFLPGLSIGLFRIVTGDPKQGSRVLATALRAWCAVVVASFSDRSNASVLSSGTPKPSATPATLASSLFSIAKRASTTSSSAASVSASPEEERDNGHPAPVTRTVKWFFTTQGHLLRQLDFLFAGEVGMAIAEVPMVHGCFSTAEASPRLRRTLIECAWRLLREARTSLGRGAVLLVEHIIAQCDFSDKDPSDTPLFSEASSDLTATDDVLGADLPPDLLDCTSTDVAPLALYVLVHRVAPLLRASQKHPVALAPAAETAPAGVVVALVDALAERFSALAGGLPHILSRAQGVTADTAKIQALRVVSGYLSVLPRSAVEGVLRVRRDVCICPGAMRIGEQRDQQVR